MFIDKTKIHEYVAGYPLHKVRINSWLLKSMLFIFTQYVYLISQVSLYVFKNTQNNLSAKDSSDADIHGMASIYFKQPVINNYPLSMFLPGTYIILCLIYLLCAELFTGIWMRVHNLFISNQFADTCNAIIDGRIDRLFRDTDSLSQTKVKVYEDNPTFNLEYDIREIGLGFGSLTIHRLFKSIEKDEKLSIERAKVLLKSRYDKTSLLGTIPPGVTLNVLLSYSAVTSNFKRYIKQGHSLFGFGIAKIPSHRQEYTARLESYLKPHFENVENLMKDVKVEPANARNSLIAVRTYTPAYKYSTSCVEEEELLDLEAQPCGTASPVIRSFEMTPLGTSTLQNLNFPYNNRAAKTKTKLTI